MLLFLLTNTNVNTVSRLFWAISPSKKVKFSLNRRAKTTLWLTEEVCGGCFPWMFGKVRAETNQMSISYTEACHLLIPVAHEIFCGLSEMSWFSLEIVSKERDKLKTKAWCVLESKETNGWEEGRCWVWLYLLLLCTFLDWSHCFMCAELVIGQVKNLRNKDEVRHAIRTAVMSKQYGNEDFLANLITSACGELFVFVFCFFAIVFIFVLFFEGGGGLQCVCVVRRCLYAYLLRTDQLRQKMSKWHVVLRTF